MRQDCLFRNLYPFKILLFPWKGKTLTFSHKSLLHLNRAAEFLGRNTTNVFGKKCHEFQPWELAQYYVSLFSMRGQSIHYRKESKIIRPMWAMKHKQGKSGKPPGDENHWGERVYQATSSGEIYFSFTNYERGRWKQQQNVEKIRGGESMQARLLFNKMIRLLYLFGNLKGLDGLEKRKRKRKTIRNKAPRHKGLMSIVSISLLSPSGRILGGQQRFAICRSKVISEPPGQAIKRSASAKEYFIIHILGCNKCKYSISPYVVLLSCCCFFSPEKVMDLWLVYSSETETMDSSHSFCLSNDFILCSTWDPKWRLSTSIEKEKWRFPQSSLLGKHWIPLKCLY